MKLAFNERDSIDYWDTLYDKNDFYGDCYRQRMAIVLSWMDGLNLSENSKILDAGCGAGRFAHEVFKRGYTTLGMDYSYGMTIKANNIISSKSGPNIGFLQGNIETLPLRSSSFDMVVCLGVIAYLESEEKALASLARVLKPGGILAISIINKARLVYHMDFPLLLASTVKKTLNSNTSTLRTEIVINDPIKLTTYFIPRFQRSLELAGFKVLEYETVPSRLLTFYGREIYPEKMATHITWFFEQFSHIPFVRSFGGMCIFKAVKTCK